MFEGAHLTSGNTRFCHESSKCRNDAFFVGQIIKHALRIILGFGSNGHPSNKNSDSNVRAPSNFWDLNQINLIYALLSRIQLCFDYALFEGDFWQKFGDGGHQNILMDRGKKCTVLFQTHNWEEPSFSAGSYVYLHVYTCICTFIRKYVT